MCLSLMQGVPSADRSEALRDPRHPLWSRPSPAAYRVRIDTTKGAFILEVDRSLAPRGSDRFYHLVETGFYNDSRFYRVIRGRCAQFGIPGDPEIAGIWRNERFQDDPVRASNVRGTFGYAMTGPDARTTQIYINTGDQSRQDVDGFAPFGKVIEGMDVVDSLYAEDGESSGGGMRAGRQGKLFEEGHAYLDLMGLHVDGDNLVQAVDVVVDASRICVHDCKLMAGSQAAMHSLVFASHRDPDGIGGEMIES